MTVTGSNGPPSLAEAAAQLGIALSDLNADFGVVVVDPERRLYAVEVDSTRIPLKESEGQPFRGPFSNPRIEPMGPPTQTTEKPESEKK